ncbi:MAG: hypothetical protein GY720_23435 [bacterium]|nr:hypothetical protein [bacterium]
MNTTRRAHRLPTTSLNPETSEMHHHDIEIIMALAEGSLDPEAAATARAEIAACPECSLDLEMQESVLAALHELPDATLTEMESARLRRNVREELGIAETTAVTSPQQKRRRMPLAALGTAAAVLVAVVVAGPALDLIGGDDDSADATVVADGGFATTSAPTAALEAAPNANDLQGSNGSEAAPETTFAAATTTTVAPPATTAAPTTRVQDPTLYAYFAQEPDLSALLSTVAGTGFDEQASRSGVLKASGDSVQEEQLEDSQTCASITISSEDNFIEAFQIARGQIDGREVLYIIYLAEDLEESELIAHAADNCEQLARTGF